MHKAQERVGHETREHVRHKLHEAREHIRHKVCEAREHVRYKARRARENVRHVIYQPHAGYREKIIGIALTSEKKSNS